MEDADGGLHPAVAGQNLYEAFPRIVIIIIIIIIVIVVVVVVIIIIIIIITTTTTTTTIIIIIIIMNLIYIAQFDTNGILTALYIVITYIQMHYVHV